MHCPIMEFNLNPMPARPDRTHSTKEVDAMGLMNRIAPVIVLFAVFIVLQPLLIALDCQQTPASVAKQFIKNYYYLDADMQKTLCADECDAGQWVNQYLQSKTDEAAQRGFSVNYLRRMFTHMHLESEIHDDDVAVVHVEGTTRTAINPLFMAIGRLFNIGQDYPVDTKVILVKEDGRWRVCQQAFGAES